MKVELKSFKNTITRKVFFLFILSAIIPLILFAFFSIRQINTILAESIQTELQNDARSYVYLLNERLTSFNFALVQFASEIQLTTDVVHWQEHKGYNRWFNSLGLIVNEQAETIFWGKPPVLNALSGDSIQSLQEGKTLLRLTEVDQTGRPHLILLKQVLYGQQRSLLMAEINLDVLWGDADSFDLRKAFCVINHEKKVLFCSKSDIQPALVAMISQAELASRGGLFWEDNNSELYAGYTSFFLQYNFAQQDWKIIFAQAKKQSIYQHSFGTIFYSILAFTLVFVLYLSLVTIRRQMKPLDALMQGISRIQDKNFSQPVPVSGDDEFGQLSMEFNRMSDRLKTQLNVLTTLSEIDQLILSRISISEIIKMVISRANDIIKSDSVSIALLTDDINSEVILYTADSQSADGISEQAYQVSTQTRQVLLTKRLLQINISEQLYLDSVQPLMASGFSSYLIIPVGHKEKISAFLVFAYQQQPELSMDRIKSGQEFADRIAVAIANATWEQQLYKQAHYDHLTGLPNRILFQDRLQHAIDQAERENETPVILFLDLDEFKNINDSLGHLAGDKLLKIIARRITSCLRKGDTVARLGGDEFVILVEGYCEQYSSSLLIMLNKILAEISMPLVLEGNQIRISTSIGVAIYPQDGKNNELLLKNADTALYEAKKQGKARYHFYSDKLNASMLKELVLESDSHNALKNNEFQLYYQPQVDAKSGLIVGAEVLLRWFHPEKGLISPIVFIPLIEQSGLIIPIGHWVMRQACQQNKLWQEKGLAKIRIAINLSIKQFTHKTLYDDIQKLIDEFKLDPQYIEIEITESTAMDDISASVNVINKIKSLGVDISIDDYGTGYSSLAYIKDFPADTLKIDRAFIINLVHSYREQAIVRSTISMAHDLGLKFVAEGVEDEAQYLLLQKMGCDEIQGYYFSKPVLAEEFEALLLNGFKSKGRGSLEQTLYKDGII